MSAAVIERCPACGSTERAPNEPPDDRVPFERIWHGLRETWSADITAETRTRLQPAESTDVVRCGGCGLTYFTPAIPGDAGFYEELGRSMPYHAARWEFGLVARSLRAGSDLVDLGCGDGGFLRAARSRVRRAVGVDHNRDGIECLRADGIEAYAEPFESFSDRNEAAFDVACSFHTLEHLASVGGLMGAAVRCLRPGGRLFLSVPNADRLRLDAFEPLDHPPHHVSRWRPDDLAALGERYLIELVSMRFEEPGYHAARAWALGRRGAGSRLALGPVRYLAMRSTHRLTARGAYGHSMLAEFRREGAA
jgi:SAM-dependent methyltransferase